VLITILTDQFKIQVCYDPTLSTEEIIKYFYEFKEKIFDNTGYININDMN